MIIIYSRQNANLRVFRQGFNAIDRNRVIGRTPNIPQIYTTAVYVIIILSASSYLK